VNDTDIVGHKTFFTRERGFYHEPLTRQEADALIEQADRAEQKRNELMPDERTAILMLFDAYQRLRDFGWRNAENCPKDGTMFKVIEAGSTGQHDCIYMGEWPSGTWWIVEDGDMCPSRPVLFKPIELSATQPNADGNG
jgi:hypothetical protein